jgi:hypothetical protein
MSGFVFLSTDYDTIEMRALAQVCLTQFGESRMAEVINSGRDLHSEMGAAIIGVTYEQIEQNKKVKGSAEKKARDYAKVVNFGAPGGLGVQSLIDYARTGYGIRIEPFEASKLLRDWKAQWPEMVSYFGWVNSLVGLGDAQITHPITGYVRGGLDYTAACNHFFQHLAAFGGKSAVFRCVQECYTGQKYDGSGPSPLEGSRVTAYVHDETDCRGPRGHRARGRRAFDPGDGRGDAGGHPGREDHRVPDPDALLDERGCRSA